MEIILLLVFMAGYLLITAEQFLKISKTATALFAGVTLWVIYVLGSADHAMVVKALMEHIGAISSILFFLMAVMTIVELIDLHDGFSIITDCFTTSNKRLLVCIISLLTFFLSAILDNLTTTIIMISLATRLIVDRKDRISFIGLIVIAANAGGAWSPIGDVTTTMLWIGGRITSEKIISRIFIPSLLCLGVPLVWNLLQLKGNSAQPVRIGRDYNGLRLHERHIVLFTGITMLISIPFFKALTHLPPYMGALFGLSIL